MTLSDICIYRHFKNSDSYIHGPVFKMCLNAATYSGICVLHADGNIVIARCSFEFDVGTCLRCRLRCRVHIAFPPDEHTTKRLLQTTAKCGQHEAVDKRIGHNVACGQNNSGSLLR